MAGGEGTPISRKLYARVKEMLAEQQRPTGPLPHVDTIVEHLMNRYSDCKRMPRNSLRKTLQQSIIPRFSLEDADGKKRRREGEGGDGEEAEAGTPLDEATPRRAEGDLDSGRPNSAMQRLYKLHSSSVAADQGEAGAGGESPARGAARASTRTPGAGMRKRPSGAAGAAGGRGAGGGIKPGEPPALRYRDLGGIETLLQQVRELVEYPLTHPEIYAHLGVEPPRGVLLHGPPGSGKTMLAGAVAAEMALRGVTFFRISAPEVVSGMSGESEATIRDLFIAAKAQAPSLIFIDEIDSITPKRENAQREMERRIVAQLLTSMDDLGSAPPPAEGSARHSEQSAADDAAESRMEKGDGDDGEEASAEEKPSAPPAPRPVMVMGATNRPDSLDTALRRAGRFDREICLGVPDEAARLSILRVLTARLRLAGDFDLKAIARATPGYVGADLAAVGKEAAAIAVNRIFSSLFSNPLPKDPASNDEAGMSRGADGPAMTAADRVSQLVNPMTPEELAPLALRMEDFVEAVKRVQPSSKREGFATVPDVTWDEVGSLEEVRAELNLSICQPILHPEKFAAFGLSAPTGVLLYGPPGCGKTLVAKAVACESHANFISVKGPELLNKFVGESERAVRQVFLRAQASAPCVIFFDELDALCPKRGSDNNASTERVVNQLLTEMDGLNTRSNVFIVAATNRPDIIDGAMLRPGRLDKLLYVGLPKPGEREAILRTVSKKVPLAPNVDLAVIARDPRLEGFSGADLASLVREAAMFAMRDLLARPASAAEAEAVPEVAARHVETAMRVVLPSVSRKDERRYEAMAARLRQSRAHVTQEGDEAIAADDSTNPASAAPAAAPARI